MDRLLRILLVLLMTLGVTRAELPSPETGCCGSCPCDMPAPQRTPQPCGTSIPAPIAALARTVVMVAECATAGDRVAREPRPWPAAWVLPHRSGDEKRVAFPVETGPPPLASERIAQLRVFRI